MRKKSIIQVALFIAVSALIIALIAVWVGRKSTPPEVMLQDQQGLDAPLSPKELAIEHPTTTNTMNPTAILTTNKGVIDIELFQDVMPITVGNFIKLANEGFYDGTKFHRVIKNFMIQGGDPNTIGDDVTAYGTGGPGYTIQDEFVKDPRLTNKRGTIAMANTGQPDSGGSQFFINTVDNFGLDFDKEPLTSKHPVFGQVVSGMDVVDTISNVETVPGKDLPVDPVMLESVKIQEPQQDTGSST
jgi:peptidylprolyl isomerase